VRELEGSKLNKKKKLPIGNESAPGKQPGFTGDKVEHHQMISTTSQTHKKVREGGKEEKNNIK
jgi:hypothetical protein